MLRMLSWHGNIGSIMHCVLHVMAVYWHVVVWWQCVPCYSLPIMCPRAACSAPPRPAPASTPPGPQCRDLRQCGSNLAASTHQHTVHCSSEHTLHLSTVQLEERWDLIVIISTLFAQFNCFLRRTISCSKKYISGLWTWCYCIVLVM